MSEASSSRGWYYTVLALAVMALGLAAWLVLEAARSTPGADMALMGMPCPLVLLIASDVALFREVSRIKDVRWGEHLTPCGIALTAGALILFAAWIGSRENGIFVAGIAAPVLILLALLLKDLGKTS